MTRTPATDVVFPLTSRTPGIGLAEKGSSMTRVNMSQTLAIVSMDGLPAKAAHVHRRMIRHASEDIGAKELSLRAAPRSGG